MKYFVLNYRCVSSKFTFKLLMMTRSVLSVLLPRQRSWLFQWCQNLAAELLRGFPGTCPSSGPYPDRPHKQQWALLPMGCSQAQLKWEVTKEAFQTRCLFYWLCPVLRVYFDHTWAKFSTEREINVWCACLEGFRVVLDSVLCSFLSQYLL